MRGSIKFMYFYPSIMKMIRQITTYIILALLLASVTSCKTSMAMKKAHKRYEIGEYYKALGYFKKAKKKTKTKTQRSEATFYIGECNRLLSNNKSAESAYKQVVRSKFEMPNLYLHYGDVLLKQKKYSAAKNMFLEHLKIDSTSVWARSGIISSDSIPFWLKNSSRYKVAKIKELSSKRGEFTPMLTGNDYEYLYFATTREGGNEVAATSAINGLRTNDIWMTRLDAQGNWIEPDPIEGEVNTEFDEGTPVFSKDGKSMYYTQCVFETGKALGAFIQKSVRSGAEWTAPTQLRFFEDSLADTLIIAHPAISSDESKIYFTSDLIGGFGGKDIWYVTQKGDGWSIPVNAGAAINTAGDEMFPMLRNDSTLYFSSNGLPGFGGLDIYKAIFGADSSVTVTNMKSPVNSEGDDFGITFAGDEERGFISSNRRDRKGLDHIYSFVEPRIEVVLKGRVLDDKSKDPLSEAVIRLIGNDGTNTKIRTKKDGSFSYEINRDAEYVFLVTSRGYLNQKGELNSIGVKDSKQYKFDFALSSISKPIQLNNVFFEFGTANVTTESKPALDALLETLKDNPNITVELSAHSDMVGDDNINMQLSIKRAQTVVDYMITNGVSTDRLVAKGYGESMPVVVDKTIAETYKYLKEGDLLDANFVESLSASKQEEVNQINRRMEFKVLSTSYKPGIK